MKCDKYEFAIIVVYVDDLNLVGTKYPLLTPLIGCSNKGDDSYLPCKEEEPLGEQYPYLATIGALLY